VTPDHHHSDVSGGWLRAAVFGAMDGLVSNIGLIAGVGGGGVPPNTIVYTSVRTQTEQVAAELEKERHELEHNPEVEMEELAQAWIERGLPDDLARHVAAVVHQNPSEALRVHAQEELGVVPEQQPSPWTAAISSFICFAIGALVPLLPYLFGATVLWPALAAGGVGLFVAGAVVARFTGRPWWKSGLRQLLLGAAAAAITYGIGRLIGANV
jgi:vacuolar iron transporter family protein